VITEQRKRELKDKGYYIEDMGLEYGPEWAGQFRWMRSNPSDFQDYGTSYSTEEAWNEAHLHDEQLEQA
jgi:hypothetical protein